MADTSDAPAKASRFAGRVEDLPLDDLEILANIDQRRARPRHKLADLLAQCDPTAPSPDYDRAWLDAPPVGREII